MSRRYPAADMYEEREREFYSRPRPARNYEDLEVDINRTRYPDRPETVVSDRRSTRGAKVPEFLREDYGRTNAGPLVVKNREPEDYPDNVSRRGGPPERIERDDLVIRERRGELRDPPVRERAPPSSNLRDVEREEIIYRRAEHEQPRQPRPRDKEFEETEVMIKRGERDRGRDREQDPPRGPPPDIVFRRGAGDRRPPPPRSEAPDDEFIYRHREETRSPPPRSERNVERDELFIRERERERSVPPPRRHSPGPIARETQEWYFRRREPSPPPPARDEREEIIIRRREREPSSPPPSPMRDEREEIIIRRRERSPPREPTPEPVREPSPEPLPLSPEPIVRPPIIQEIITHHRHIDHGLSSFAIWSSTSNDL